MPMKEPNNKRGANILWNVFSSMKLTLALLIILAITSLFGTLIPQQQEAVRFAQGLSPRLHQFFELLGLFDLYHSLWFRAIIGLLALNLVICSVNRLPTTLKLFRAPSRPDRSKPFEDLPPQRNFLVERGIEDVGNRVADFLRNQYGRIVSKSTPEKNYLYAEKGRYSYFGVYLVHFSILLVLIGGVIGSVFGFNAYVNILEGDTVDSIILTKDMTSKRLGFSVFCEKFNVDYYDNGSPKEFRSDLGFLVEGKLAKKASLLMNRPITFGGITFYQSSYGSIPGKAYLSVQKEGSDLVESIVRVEIGDTFSLPGSESQIQVVNAVSNLNEMMGPAALISVKSREGEEIRFWVFQNIEKLRNQYPEAMFQAPRMNPSSFKPYTFFLKELESRFYTGLQANKNPGVSLVWFGCVVMVAGFFMTFFTSHRKIWVRILRSTDETKISVAGRTNRNPLTLEKELDLVTSQLHKLLD
ncbi:MAG: cytochrome c biogenesis protein ResB [Deltaproteobacteria bacterium]|nr:cytochrome c biogenesis protein ResB [Deltaproteobacteria bacterium]